MKSGRQQRKRPTMGRTEVSQKYYETHREEISQKKRERYQANLDKARERSREYYRRKKAEGARPQKTGRPSRANDMFMPDSSICIPVSTTGSIKLLAINVIRQAVIDWRKRNRMTPAERRDLRQFFGSFHFENWCDAAGINPDCVLQELKILRVDHRPE